MRKHNWKWATTYGCTLALLLVVVVTQSAQAQTFNVIHNFTGGPDGSSPVAGLTIDRRGNLYGTSFAGGSGYGTVYRLTYNGGRWVFNPLYSFNGNGSSDGAGPYARVVFGSDGILYGTTQAGGGAGCSIDGYAGCGTVFKLSVPPAALSPWTETVLYRFTGGSDGAFPIFGDLNFDQAGNIYGTAENYPNPGNAYELMRSGGTWTHSVLYTFNAPDDGCFPTAGVTFDKAGTLYGASSGCGIFGTFWTLTPSGSGWTENVLYRFPQDTSQGGDIYAGLLLDQAGNFYGAAAYGGAGGGGTAFELSNSNGNWTISRLYSFTGAAGHNCGPFGTLVMDGEGNLYGTTYCDGVYGYGNVFELSPSNGGWTYKDLYDFTGGSDGGNPISNVLLHPNGKLYGTASVGGSQTVGVVWEITP